MAEAKRRLYLAYGSNLNLEQMAHRCPTARVVGSAVLHNWRLAFRGAATIERCKGFHVSVLIWDIQPRGEAALDIYEGWPHLYRKEMRRVTLYGKTVTAMVYIMNGRRTYYPPAIAYYNTILDGYISAGFDTNLLREAALGYRNEKSKRGRTTMNETIKAQILAVRDTGETNMLDTNTVQVIANREGYYDLVIFIEEHRRDYARFIMTGEE